MKQFVKSLSRFGVEINFAMDSGVSFGGLNISQARKPLADRSSAALHHCQTLGAKTILDVGSGGGHHASAFAAKGGQVTCIDFGTSVYAQEKGHAPGIELVEVDFLHWQSPKTFDLVWASHVLEHQRNPGQFIDKLISLCAPKGHVAIIVPTPHRRLWGGHLTLWTPGLLAYNIVMAGIDLSDCVLEYGYRETWLVFQPSRFKMPDITYDKGDINLLSPFFPKNFKEDADSWF